MIGVSIKTLGKIKAILDETRKEGFADSKAPGMVYQIWEDGEITLQKSGELLGMRNLHMVALPIPETDISGLLARKMGDHAFSYIPGMDTGKKIRMLLGRDTIY